MEHLKQETTSGTQFNLDALYKICPSCFTEARDEKTGELHRVVDFNKLRALLGDNAIEDQPETYDFTWVGKNAARREAAAPIRKTLRPCPEESEDWENTQNLYIEGDNLEVLKLLQNSYMGKIKMIYIDPPYNTGNDFVYHDDYKVSREEYEQEAGNLDEEGNRYRKNTETNGRFHSDWCSMIYARLMVARSLLTEDGVIFISIDDNEVENLRKMCDEVFGESNFVTQITLLCNPKGRSQDKYIANCHEYLLLYSKQLLPNGNLSIPKTKEEISKDYPLFDTNGSPYRELELRNTHRDFGKFNRKNLWYPLYVSDDGEISINNITGSKPVYPIWEDGFEGCWTWGKDKSQANIELLVAKNILGKTKIYRKAYAFIEDKAPIKQVKSIWTDKSFFTEKGQAITNVLFKTKTKLFQAPKSVDMIMQCVSMAQTKNDIVLDFFSGSATAAHAVMQLNAEDGGNRKFIMVQLPEPTDKKSEAYKAGYKNICEIGKERIRRSGKKMKEENKDKEGIENLDTGFRVFKCDSSNMKDVYYPPVAYNQNMLWGMLDNIKEDRTDLDLLFGCMLEWGVELSLPLSKETIDGCDIHIVNAGDLVACFSLNITENVVNGIAEKMPLRVIFRDSSFDEAAHKMNLFERFKQICGWSEEEVKKNIKVI